MQFFGGKSEEGEWGDRGGDKVILAPEFIRGTYIYHREKRAKTAFTRHHMDQINKSE